MSDINDFVIEDGVLIAYEGDSSDVVIPDSVSSIGEEAFRGCTRLTSVEIPSSVSSIGERAFYGCTNLKKFSISQDNEFFASVNEAIYSKDRKKLIQYVCLSNATHFSIPDGVTSIGDYVFFECTGLTSIEIPYSVIEIGEDVFDGCNDNLVIITSADSYAEEYAMENGIKVKFI